MSQIFLTVSDNEKCDNIYNNIVFQFQFSEAYCYDNLYK